MSKATANTRRRGPKPRPAEELRQYCVSVRFSPAEIALIDARRGQMRRPEFLRAAALRRLPPQIPGINREAWASLAKAATNLHSLAKAANFGQLPELAEVQAALVRFRNRLIGARPGGHGVRR